MKALTFWQPWATLVMAGFKPFEFRRYAAPRWIVGQRIVIHAGSRPVRVREVAELRERVLSGEHCGDLNPECVCLLSQLMMRPDSIPLSAGLGTAVIGSPKLACEIWPDDFNGYSDSDRVEHSNWGLAAGADRALYPDSADAWPARILDVALVGSGAMIDRFTIAAIHVGKNQLGLDDDTYRALLQQLAGVGSSKDLDDAGAGRVLTEMRRRGFDGTSKPRRSLASQPLARKARAMWLALWNLDETESGHEKVLAAFAKGITGKDDLRFCTAGELTKVVEALKAWSNRIGLSLDRASGPLDARRAVVREQWARLHAAGWAQVAGDRGIAGYAHRTWCTPNARAVDQMEAEHLDQLAARLGPIVRQHKCGRWHQQNDGSGL